MPMVRLGKFTSGVPVPASFSERTDLQESKRGMSLPGCGFSIK